MRFSDKLPKLRKENNLSQEQLADKLGVSRQAISKWESGQSYPDMDKMIQICSILNCTLEDLLDDGVIKSKKDNIEIKNNLNNYFTDFLKFITKSYNMFFSMTFKEKITLIFEMLILIFMLYLFSAITMSILNTIFYSILNTIFYNIFNFLPLNVYNVSHSILKTICDIFLLIIGVIITIHIYKIRYLDYFVTIEDSNTLEKTIEEPIEKLENKKYVQKKKEKIIIRDPKHSTFSFMNLLIKMIVIVLKFFIILFAIPVIIFFVFNIFISILTICHIVYGIIFLYIFMALFGLTLFTYLIIKLFYNFIFNIKNDLKKLFIIFIISLLLIGIGFGLTFARALKYNYTNDNALKMTTKEEHIKVNDDIYLNFNPDNTSYIIDNSLDDIKIEITLPEKAKYKIDKYEYYDEEIDKNEVNYYISFDLGSIAPLDIYHLVLNDLKNNEIHNYNNSYEIKVYLSEENYKKINK